MHIQHLPESELKGTPPWILYEQDEEQLRKLVSDEKLEDFLTITLHVFARIFKEILHEDLLDKIQLTCDGPIGNQYLTAKAYLAKDPAVFHRDIPISKLQHICDTMSPEDLIVLLDLLGVEEADEMLFDRQDSRFSNSYRPW